jgi:hypothetical protein
VFRAEAVRGLQLTAERVGIEPEVAVKVVRLGLPRQRGSHPLSRPNLRARQEGHLGGRVFG